MLDDAIRSVNLSLSAAEHQTKTEQRQHQLPDSFSRAGIKELSCCYDVNGSVDVNDGSTIQDIKQRQHRQQQPAESACQLDANFCVTKCVRAVRAGGQTEAATTTTARKTRTAT